MREDTGRDVGLYSGPPKSNWRAAHPEQAHLRPTAWPGPSAMSGDKTEVSSPLSHHKSFIHVLQTHIWHRWLLYSWNLWTSYFGSLGSVKSQLAPKQPTKSSPQSWKPWL